MQEQLYALIKDSVVVNIIVADDDFVQTIRNDFDAVVYLNPLYAAGTAVAIGYNYTDGVFTPPESPAV